jgi:hypothetical protein
MNNKSCFSWGLLRPASRWLRGVHYFAILAALSAFVMLGSLPAARAGDAPAWMHSLVNAPLPEYDEKTDAVLLYSEEILNVQPNGKIKSTERRVYKILRPDGRRFGRIHAYFDSETRITSIHGWCIPAQGKDYEVKDKEALEMGLNDVENGILLTDQRVKVLQIPAAGIGNTVGFEIEHEDRPYILQDVWDFQNIIPVREARYTLQLPAGWEYKATWVNYPEVKSTATGGNQWQWVVTDVAALKRQEQMPPWRGIAGVMIISFLPPGGAQGRGFANWREMGNWEAGLEQGRRDASPEIKQKVATLTASLPTQLAKMQALAKFVQGDIRYVAIELGIGGWQPHPAPEIFTHRYGDCKDKATLMSSMLHEIGVESFYISINTVRGGAAPDRPPMIGWFNHEILAVRLPDDVKDKSLVAIAEHPKLGRLLIFDPTDEYTPFGQLRGELQANYGLLVTPDGGELVKLPQLPAALSGVQRTAKLTLSTKGTLSGEIVETRLGDSGLWQRVMLKSATKETDKIKPIESLVSNSLSTFQITKATVLNLNQTDQPFGYQYSLVAENYAKTAGNLLLVRPRVLGSKSSDILETKEPRQFAVELPGPERDTDTFEIAIPAGYEVDDLPPPVSADYSFASYHSKTEVNGNTLKYTRTFEVKELSVPVSKAEDLKKLYRIIAGDERNTAVLKPVGH